MISRMPEPASGRRGPGRSAWRGPAGEVVAGLSLACMAVPILVAAGVLTHQPLGADFVSVGALSGLAGGIAGGLVATLARQSSFIVPAPASPSALVLASSVAALVPSLGGEPALILAAITACAALTAVWVILFGLVGVGRIVQYTPYPVMTGFISGIAALLVISQLPVVLGADGMDGLLAMEAPRVGQATLGIGLVALMLALSRWQPRLPAPLIGLAAGAILHPALAAMIPDADFGPTVGSIPEGGMAAIAQMRIDGLTGLAAMSQLFPALIAISLTLALVVMLDTLLSTRSLRDLDYPAPSERRELVGQGVGGLAAVAAGGVVLSTSMALTMGNQRGGARTRVSVVTACLILLAGVTLLPQGVAALPIIALAAILVFSGIAMFDRRIFGLLRDAVSAREPARRTRARRNALVLMAVLVTTAMNYPHIGAAIGVTLACVIFIVDMARPVVRSRSAGDRIQSKRARPTADMDVLRSQGGRTGILRLQGVLFFGNADELADAMRAMEPGADRFVLDFQRVTDLDASGVNVLEGIARRLRARGKALALCTIAPPLADMLAPVDALAFKDLDGALEWAEADILAAGTAAEGGRVALEDADLVRGLSTADVETLRGFLSPASYASGAILCRAADPPDGMWLLVRGAVSVRIGRDGEGARIASIAPGATVGEMALLEGKPRSAAIVADEELDTLFLDSKSFRSLNDEHPRIGQIMISNIATVLAQRLRAMSESLQFSEN